MKYFLLVKEVKDHRHQVETLKIDNHHPSSAWRDQSAKNLLLFRITYLLVEYWIWEKNFEALDSEFDLFYYHGYKLRTLFVLRQIFTAKVELTSRIDFTNSVTFASSHSQFDRLSLWDSYCWTFDNFKMFSCLTVVDSQEQLLTFAICILS